MGWTATKASATQVTIAGYPVLEKIGQGSGGTVYKAKNPRNGKTVAIKVIPCDFSGDSVHRMRFAQECQVTKQLNHPHIVRVLDFGVDGNKAYMVMEYVDGESLGDKIERDGALPEAEALRLVQQIGQGLHAAHKRRLVHRDIKPDNILLTADGNAKLADLGLVKNLEGDADLTRTKSCLGTPNFMAPEQFEDAKHATVRSDIYALAATLYMMVTGELPFRARSMSAVAAIYKKQRANDIIPPSRVVKDIRPSVEAAILRGMRANPTERFASVEEFLEALHGTQAPPRKRSSVIKVRKKDSSAQGVKEHRAKKRFDCERTTACRPMQWVSDSDWFGQILNISETGLCLRLSRRFEPGAILSLLLESDKSRRQSVLVRVVWARKVDEKHWQLGCQYDQPLCDFEVDEIRAAGATAGVSSQKS